MHLRALPSLAAPLIVALAASLSLTLPLANAATRDFYFARYGSEYGLGQNTVSAIVQDPQGFVWVGTQGGLHRFDGQRYMALRHDPANPASLPDNFITALALEGQRSLWIGTYSQYVARLDLSNGRIESFASHTGQERNQRQVTALLADNGRVWVGTVGGLERLDPATGQRKRVLQLDPSGMLTSPWQQLLRDPQGHVWYATAAGLYRVDDNDHVSRIGPSAPARSLLLDSRGQVWAGFADGLYQLEADGQTLRKRWPTDATGPADIRALSQGPDQQLWLSVYGAGLRRFDPANKTVYSIREEPRITATLPEDTINALMLDRGGMLWAGGQFRGVSVTDPRGSPFRYVVDLSTQTRQGNAAADDSVRAVHEGSDGTLWIGTDDSRLVRYRFADDHFDDFTRLLPGGGQPRRIPAFADAGDGWLWAATAQGLVRLNAKTGATQPVDMGAHSQASLRAVATDAQGRVWLGTADAGGLRFDPATGQVTAYPSRRNAQDEGLAHPSVHAVLVDRRGRVWFGTGDGLDLLDPVSGKLEHFRNDPTQANSLAGNVVRALLETADGTVWVGSHGGLSRVIEGAGGRVLFAHPLSSATAPIPVVFSLGLGADGALWLGTDNGLMRYTPGNDRVRRFGLADGVQDLEFNGGAATRLSDGRLVFGGVRGLNVFSPTIGPAPSYQPPLQLLSVRVGNEAADRDAARWQSGPVQVPSGAQLLRLRIGALDYAPAANLHYRYRMQGFDEGWIDNGAQQDITYTQLPGGRYTFHAQVTDHNGEWKGKQIAIPVHVARPLWRHPLLLTLAALLALGPAALALWQWTQRRRRELDYIDQIQEREERLNLALWASDEQFWDYDVENRVLHRMRAKADPDDPAKPGVHTFAEADHEIHPEDKDRVLSKLRAHLRGEVPVMESEHRIRHSTSGAWYWIRGRGRVVKRNEAGRALRVAGTARDVSADRSAERERQIAHQVLGSMAEAVVVLDRTFAFISVNTAFTRITGYDDGEAIGRSFNLLESPQHDADVYRQVRATLESLGSWSGELWLERKDGSEFLCMLQAGAVTEGDERSNHFVAVLTDITEQKRTEQELRYLANYDTLTSLPNRTLMSERLSRAIVRARRNGSRIGVLFLDLDRFKDINDSLGHAAGDKILRAAASRLQQTVGAQHTVARLGGDEFTVVLENVEFVEDAEAIARQVLDAFERPLDVPDLQDVVISPSIGISMYPENAQIPADLLKHADTAMYQAKAMGRRTFTRYTDSMDVEAKHRAVISAALRKVIDRGELRLVFQPRLSLKQQRIIGVEALLRWQSAEHGAISPVQFIPLAEESGMILEIGEWALREACIQLQAWLSEGLDLTVAVNVSALQLLRGDLPEVVARTLEDTGLPPHYLDLELTESVIMQNAEHTGATLQAFRDLGVGLAVDDFGTGYSSLAYLKRLPINTLKIDKEFIDDLTRDPDDEAITSAVIAMAHSLGLLVVAEGVETVEQMRFLAQHNCDEIQGFWLARPMEAEQCTVFLRTWTPDLLDTSPTAEAS